LKRYSFIPAEKNAAPFIFCQGAAFFMSMHKTITWYPDTQPPFQRYGRGSLHVPSKGGGRTAGHLSALQQRGRAGFFASIKVSAEKLPGLQPAVIVSMASIALQDEVSKNNAFYRLLHPFPGFPGHDPVVFSGGQ
jgi:hypothetical protein